MGSLAPTEEVDQVQQGPGSSDAPSEVPTLGSTTHYGNGAIAGRASVNDDIVAAQIDSDGFTEELARTKAMLEVNSDATSGEESGPEVEETASQVERTFLKEQRLEMLVEMEQIRQSITKEMHTLVQQEVAKQLARKSFGVSPAERQRSLEAQLEQVEADRAALASKAALLKVQLKKVGKNAAGEEQEPPVVEPVVKRGRGRPPKKKPTETPGRPAKTPQKEATPVKKARGRPRKPRPTPVDDDVEDLTGFVSSDEEEPTPARRRRSGPPPRRPSRSAKVAANMRITDDFELDAMEVVSSDDGSDDEGLSFQQGSEEEEQYPPSLASPVRRRKPAAIPNKVVTPMKKTLTKRQEGRNSSLMTVEMAEDSSPSKKRARSSEEKPRKKRDRGDVVDVDRASEESIEELVEELDSAIDLEGKVEAALKLASRFSSSAEARKRASKIPGTIKLLVRLLASSMGPELRSICAETLAWLMSDVSENRLQLGAEKRGLSSLVDLLSSALPQNCRLNGVMALSNAVSNCPQNAKLLIATRGALAHIVRGLKPSMPEYARAYAALTLENIARTDGLLDKVVQQRGCVAGVMSLLAGTSKARDPNVIEQALSTLWALCASAHARSEVKGRTDVLDSVTELGSKVALSLLSLLEDSDEEEDEEEESSE